PATSSASPSPGGTTCAPASSPAARPVWRTPTLEPALEPLEATMRTLIFVSLIGCFAGAAGAEEPAPPATDPSATAAPATPPATPSSATPATPSATAAAPVAVAKPAPKLPGKFLVYTSFAFNVYTYLGESGMSPATNITPADRAIIYQQL